MRAVIWFLALVGTLAMGPRSCTAQDVTAETEWELGNGLVDQRVTNIQVAQDASLYDFASSLSQLTRSGSRPFTLKRSVSIRGLDPARDTAYHIPVLDMAYTGGMLNASAGTTLLLQGLRLLRTEMGVPFGFIRDSPGVTVVVDASVLWLEVCPPHEYVHAFLMASPRPRGVGLGPQQATLHGSSPLWQLDDVAITLPVTPEGLGGYDLHLTRSTVECGSVVPLPEEPACHALREGGAASTHHHGPVALPADACAAAVHRAVKDKLCSLPTCVAACRSVLCSPRKAGAQVRYSVRSHRH